MPLLRSKRKLAQSEEIQNSVKKKRTNSSADTNAEIQSAAKNRRRTQKDNELMTELMNGNDANLNHERSKLETKVKSAVDSKRQLKTDIGLVDESEDDEPFNKERQEVQKCFVKRGVTKVKAGIVIEERLKEDFESVIDETEDKDKKKQSKSVAKFINKAVESEKDEGELESSSESEWEEVEERSEPVIPKEGITITIQAPQVKAKKKFDINAEIIRRINRFQQEAQLSMHKVHLLCLFAHGLRINSHVNADLNRAVALSFMPTKLLKKIELSLSFVNRLLFWFKDVFTLDKIQAVNCIDVLLSDRLRRGLDSRTLFCDSDYVCVFLIYLRLLGFKSRLILSLRPLPLKLSAQQLMKPAKQQQSDDKELRATVKKQPSKKKSQSVEVKPEKKSRHSSSHTSKRFENIKKINYNDGCESENERCSVSAKTKVKKRKSKDSESEDEFEVKEEAVRKKKLMKSDNASDENEVWVEVYVEDRWISVDCVRHLVVDQPYHFERSCGKPFEYVLALDSLGCVVDVTRRYAEGCLTPRHRKLRVDSEWWTETLYAFQQPDDQLIAKEIRQLDDALLQRPLPNTLAEYKNHPFYVLKKHLLKFEGIYPADAVPVGYFRKEPVYSRDCVHVLHARETWFKEARLVKPFETPYKVVKARPKWIRATREVLKDQPLEIFGRWQTEDYVAPVATGGLVPRNQHGNVDLLKPCMLPVGTVHLKLPGLIRVAKKLNIDCGAAFVGWEFTGGSNHPVFDGWVICEEFRDVLVDAWREEQQLAKEREQEKKDKRVYSNWKRLIKGLLISERLKAMYFNNK